MSPTKLWRTALAGTGALTISFVVHGLGNASAADSVYECNEHGGHQVVLLVDHTSGAISTYSTIQEAIDNANSTAASSTGSGAGDTVIACHGVYPGNISIPLDKQNITVRSEDGPSQVKIVGNGTAPVVTILSRGVSFGGPAEGFTVTAVYDPTKGALADPVIGIQEGVPGAQSQANEDEQCAVDPTTLTTASGCDQQAPDAVTVNDQIMDNVLTSFNVPTTAQVVGIKLDNTINSVVQQNLLTKVFPHHEVVDTFEGIMVGGTHEQPGATAPSDWTVGDSTNINTGVLQNAITNVFPEDSQNRCSASNGIELNGFMLDATVFNNKIQTLADDKKCKATGIYSNAYGSLENEQTGTLAPVNANIDDNMIQTLNDDTDKTEGIVLAPDPAHANPQPEPAPSGCVEASGQSCKDTLPPSSYTVVQNEIQKVYTAVHDEALLGANSYIRFNNFDQDVVGVENDASAGSSNMALDATNDWWGCELSGNSGPPSDPTVNNHGCAALVDGGGYTSWAPPQSERVENAGSGAGKNAGTS